jgi:hypothetical protein
MIMPKLLSARPPEDEEERQIRKLAEAQLAPVEQWFKANGVDFSNAVVDFGL